MSSLRNSLHRRNHKERSQLAHRERFGILEKHKDYVLRARDYHSKQDRIKRLRQKAADRNKDEFYFGMSRQRTEGGVHVQDRGNTALPIDMVKVLKSQDGNYIRAVRTAGLKKIEKLKNRLSALADLFGSRVDDDDEEGLDEDELQILREAGILAGTSKTKSPKHLVFVENEDEARRHGTASQSAPSVTEAPMILSDSAAGTSSLGWKTPAEGKVKKNTKGGLGSAAKEDNIASKAETALHRQRLLKELSARLTRDRMLRYAERELEMQKHLMGKGGSRKIQGVAKEEDAEKEDEEDEDASSTRRRINPSTDPKTYKPRVYKWRAERKR